MMKLWCFGDTAVRSPFRLRDGLKALSQSALQGSLRGNEENEKAFRNLLGEVGIVTLGKDKTYSAGRKWRSAMEKLGFIYGPIPKNAPFTQVDIGTVDTITPNGWQFIRASTTAAMQECFLRAMCMYYIEPDLGKKEHFSAFSPLRHVLSIMLELEKLTGSSRLNFIEMAVVVQLSTSDDPVTDIVTNILEVRSRREKAHNKKKFDTAIRLETAKIYKPDEKDPDKLTQAAGTFRDYADTNIRYLKATGLVQGKGRGLSIVPMKHVLIEKLLQEAIIPVNTYDYFVSLTNGAALPTDNIVIAKQIHDDLVRQLKERKLPFDPKNWVTKTVQDYSNVRHEIEELIFEHNEEAYAEEQVNEWEEIAAFMQLLVSGKPKATLNNGDEIKIPGSENSVYFEWILWRSFLAINSLKNKPYEARRFKVDQDFLPIGTAAGGGPDMIFEFDDFVIVVEVTLTENSRQEAAEGEPVRRHVADEVIKYADKPVYGLFIANRIDSNTAETFRIGIWYSRDDTKMQLDIVPLTLTQFKVFFEALFKCGRIEVNLLRELLDQCKNLRHHEAPEWKREIETTVHQFCQLI